MHDVDMDNNLTDAASGTSPQQAAALALVRAGRVTYGDPYPRTAARTGRPGLTSFMVDGSSVYGGQHSTFESLALAGRITAECDRDGTAHPVTEETNRG